MKIFFVIFILFLIFYNKIIEGVLEDISQHSSELLGATFLCPISPHLKKKELKREFTTAPSSVGSGATCPVSPLLNDELPPCMNGFFCDPDAYPEFEEVGRCRKNTIRDNIFY